VEDLAAVMLSTRALLHGKLRKRLGVRLAAPQPARHSLLGDRAQNGRDAGLAEVLLSQDVDGHLRPSLGHGDVLELEHHRTVRVGDAGATAFELDAREGTLVVLGEEPGELHERLRRSLRKAWIEREEAVAGLAHLLGERGSVGAAGETEY
jgi:hypothetical protein